MSEIHLDYLAKADGAMSRGDYLTAMQFALRAADVPKGMESLRCDAYILLALTNLELEMGEDALAFAVGASLSATWVADENRMKRANAIVALVMARFPNLREQPPDTLVH